MVTGLGFELTSPCPQSPSMSLLVTQLLTSACLSYILLLFASKVFISKFCFPELLDSSLVLSSAFFKKQSKAPALINHRVLSSMESQECVTSCVQNSVLCDCKVSYLYFTYCLFFAEMLILYLGMTFRKISNFKVSTCE